jgi:hypothetical protein
MRFFIAKHGLKKQYLTCLVEAKPTLTGNCAIQCVSFYEHRFTGTLSMSLQDVDGLNGVFDIPSQIDRLYSLHRIDSHRREKIIVARSTKSPGQKVPKKEEKKTNRTYFPIILLDIDVLATLISASLPRVSTLMLNCSCMNLTASLHASR